LRCGGDQNTNQTTTEKKLPVTKLRKELGKDSKNSKGNHRVVRKLEMKNLITRKKGQNQGTIFPGNQFETWSKKGQANQSGIGRTLVTSVHAEVRSALSPLRVLD